SASGERSRSAQRLPMPLNHGRKAAKCPTDTRNAAAGLKPCARGIQGGQKDQKKMRGGWGGAGDRAGNGTGWRLGTQKTGGEPVEIVVAAGAGGASDQMARMMQAAVQKNNLMKQPMVVSLKGGASGAEALIYMKSNEGDPNKVLIAYSLIYMLPLSAKIPINWRDLTPVSVIALDQFVLWVNTQLPYKTVKEFADAAKAASPPFKMGGTGSRREDHVLTVFLEQKTGAKFA